MKTKLILGSLLALSVSMYSQTNTNPWPSSGDVGIGTTSPADHLHISTATGNSGITITETSGGSNGSRLLLENKTTGGKDWAIYSLGNGNTQGAGNFLIYDQSGAKDRLFIQGSTGNVGIGLTNPSYKLHMTGNTAAADGIKYTQTGSGSASLFLDRNNSNNWSINSLSSGNFSLRNETGGFNAIDVLSNGKIGVGGTALGAQLQVHDVAWGGGVIAESNATTNCYGIAGNATSGNTSPGVTAKGVHGSGGGAGKNYGGYFYGFPDPSCTAGVVSYGIYASVTGGANPPCTNDYAGFFDGNVNINGGGNIVSAWNITSDRKFKKDIKLLSNSMDKIRLLRPSTYSFRIDEFRSMPFPQKQQLGLIAQELEQVFPELVSEVATSERLDKDGKLIDAIPEHKVVNYIGLIPVLISGLQEQDKTITDLKKQVEDLTQKLSSTTGINEINMANVGFQMSQNEPNPFTHETVVKYTLPQTVSNAFMAVYDLTGKQIATFPITEKGASSMTITSEKLAAGIYIYSIIADGKMVDSKRMVVAEK